MGKKLDEDTINEIIKEAEQNDYLFSLLYVCYSNGLKVRDCTNGDKKRRINPSISFILEKDNMDVYRNIIGILEDIPNIIVDTIYDTNVDVDYKNKKILRVTTYNYNRDEVFYKLSHVYDVKNEITSADATLFFARLHSFLFSSKSEIENKIIDGMLVSASFNTLEEKMIRYEKSNNNVILRLYNELFSKYKYQDYEKEPQYKIKKIKEI